MATTSASFSSLLNIPTPKTQIPETKISFSSKKKPFSTSFPPLKSASSAVVDSPPAKFFPPTTSNPLGLDLDVIIEQEAEKSDSKIGARVRVKAPLKVYHVPRIPVIDLTGKIGVLKQYLAVYKGVNMAASLPYRVEFVADGVVGRDGKPVKFTAHLDEHEFEFLE